MHIMRKMLKPCGLRNGILRFPGRLGKEEKVCGLKYRRLNKVYRRTQQAARMNFGEAQAHETNPYPC